MVKSQPLPERLEDLLPSEAEQVESTARRLLDWLLANDYRLVMPPLADSLDSLLTDADETLATRTLRLTDPLGGAAIGIRADITPQIRRIDASLPCAGGVQRLCYCGSTLYARPAAPWRSRELLQFGAELFGEPPPGCDSEMAMLALESLRNCGVADLSIAVGHAGIANELLAGLNLARAAEPRTALARHDLAWFRQHSCPENVADRLSVLVSLCGGPEIAAQLPQQLPELSCAQEAAEHMQSVCGTLASAKVPISVDLAGLSGYGYHSGITFALLSGDRIVARGGRYGSPGRPATGFSTDVRELAGFIPAMPRRPGVAGKAHWEDPAWRRAVGKIAATGKRLVRADAAPEEALLCPERLVLSNGQWIVEAANNK